MIYTNTGSPESMAIDYSNHLYNLVDEDDLRQCSICDVQEDKSSMAQDIDTRDLYCKGCCQNGSVTRFLVSCDYTPDMIDKILSQVI